MSQDTRYAVVNSNHNTAFIMTFIFWSATAILWTISDFASVAGHATVAWQSTLLGWFSMFAALIGLSKKFAISHAGYNRALWNQFVTIGYPPLLIREYWDLEDYDETDEQWEKPEVRMMEDDA